jgi:hypothetical protein
MSKVKHISSEELAANLADVLNKVRQEHTAVVVEYASGEKVLIKPYAPARRSAHKGAMPVADNSTLLPLPSQSPDTENVSSVGAMYDLDPNSITPG